MKLFPFMCFCCIVQLNSEAFSQVVFQKAFTGTSNIGLGYYVSSTNDYGYIIAGATNQFGVGGYDAYLIKTDNLGDTLWTKTFGTSGNEGFYYIQQTSDLGYIATGYTNSIGNTDVLLVKTDSLGNLLWSKTYGGSSNMEQSYGVQQTYDNGYIIEGFSKTFGAGQDDVYIIKTDSVGNLVWSKTFGGTNIDSKSAVKQTSDGGFILAGSTMSYGVGQNDVYLIKIDIFGNVIWSKTFGGNGNEGAAEVLITSDGGFIIAGNTNSYGAGDYDKYIIKTDSLGNLVWSRTYGSSGFDTNHSICQTNDEGYVMTGSTTSFGAVDFDIYFIKIDSIGNPIWSKTIGGTGNDQISSIKQTYDNGYIHAGITTSFGLSLFNLFLIKSDSLGNSGGCNTINVTSVTTTPSTQITIPPTITTSPATIENNPSITVGYGANINSLCPTGFYEVVNKKLFEISPNPSKGYFIISFDKQIANARIEIQNMLGEKIYDDYINSESTMSINLYNISAGIYLIKVFNNEMYLCKKILIEQH